MSDDEYDHVFPWEQEGTKETPLSLVIGKVSSWDKDDFDIQEIPTLKLLDWSFQIEDILRPINWESGYGGAECPAIHVWTETRVWFIGHYDGMTWWTSVPRNPQDSCPHLVGGG